MIPIINNGLLLTETEQEIPPSATYAVNFENGTAQGRIDGVEALQQSVFCRLSTTQGQYSIYSDAYGLPIHTLLGQPVPLVYVNIADAITRTLLEDDRITGVTDFVFDTDKKQVTVSFRA